MNQWYVRFGDDDPVGPVKTEHLIISIRAGDIPVTSLVARVGDDKWVPLASVLEFAEAVRQVALFVPPTPSPRAATPPTERNWYTSGADGSTSGPFPTSQITWNIHRGMIPVGTLACEAGAGDWKEVESIPCFAEAFRPPGSTVPEQQEAATVVFHQPESHAIGSAPAFDPRAPLAGGVQVPEQRPQQRSGAQGGPPPRRPATAPTERSWYISAIDGSTSGPFPKSQLISVIERGSVPYGTMVCEDGASEWQDIKAIPYFAEAFDRLGARVPAQVPAAAIPVQARPERLGQAAPLPPAALKPGLETARAPQKPQGHQGAATGTSGAQKPTVQAPRATGMPLIQCPDCHKQISDAAPACPGCGRPMTQAAPTAPPPFGALSMGGEVCPASSDRSAPQARGIPKTRKPFAPSLRKTAPIWIGGAVGVSAVVVVLWAVLADDKAQPKYDECVKLEGQGDLKGAVAACEAAVAASPESKGGKAASEKLQQLQPKLLAHAAKTAASSTPTSTGGGKPAGDVLREKPDLLVEFPYGSNWLDRVVAHRRGENNAKACPAMQGAKGKDEFEQRAAAATAMASCKADNDRAVEFMRKCALSYEFEVTISKYDFSKGSYFVQSERGWHPGKWSDAEGAVANDKAFLGAGTILSWPGIRPSYATMNDALIQVGCSGPINETTAAFTSLYLYWRMAEAEAKKLRDTHNAAHDDSNAHDHLEVAYVLDGPMTTVQMPCSIPVPSSPSGRILAWRLTVSGMPPVPLTDWITVSNWTPPDSCADAKQFFNPENKPRSVRSRGSAAAGEASCVCSLLRKWNRHWLPSLHLISSWARPAELAEQKAFLESAREILARMVTRVEQSTECEGERAPKQNMLSMTKELQAMHQKWAALLDKNEVTESQAAPLQAQSDVLSKRLDAILDSDCQGPQCRFGCKKPR